MSHSMLATVALVFAAFPMSLAQSRSCKSCIAPKHSWDRIPVSIHWATGATGSNGGFSDEDLATIVKFPLVTIEKWQGFTAMDSNGKPVFLWEEDAWLTAAKQIKAINSSISVNVWMDTMLIYTGWNMSGTGLNTTLNPDILGPCTTGHFRPAEFLEAKENRDYLVKNSSGLPALESWSHCHVYDHSKPEARQYWTDMCLNMTDSGVIDGCGADFSAMAANNWEMHNPSYIMKELGVDNATAVAWGAGHRQMMNDTQVALGEGLLIAKDWRELGDHANAVLQEGCPAANSTITMLQHIAALAKTMNRRLVYQCHIANIHNNTNVPAFLIGAGDDHYITTGGWYNGAAKGHWNELFERPLGEPLGPGVYDAASQMWSRSFKSGTKVTFSAATNKGAIEWADTA